MSLIPGIDPDSLLQGGWQLAPGGLKMAAAQVNDPGSNLHDHAAQHLDASARYPLRLAAERSYSTPPPCAPGLHLHGEPTRLHPHGEPTPCPSHMAAAAVAGHSHPSPVDGGRAAGGPPLAGCSWAAAGAQSIATDEAYENLSTLLLEVLDEFDQPPSATLPPPSVRLSGTPLPPPSERPCGGPHSPPRPSVACGFQGTLAALARPQRLHQAARPARRVRRVLEDRGLVRRGDHLLRRLRRRLVLGPAEGPVLSSAEAEIAAGSIASKRMIYIRNVLGELFTLPQIAISHVVDNSATPPLTENLGVAKKSEPLPSLASLHALLRAPRDARQRADQGREQARLPPLREGVLQHPRLTCRQQRPLYLPCADMRNAATTSRRGGVSGTTHSPPTARLS